MKRATHAEKESFLADLGLGLGALRAVSPTRREAYLRVWRTFLHRSELAPRELRALTHLARRLAALRPAQGKGAPAWSRPVAPAAQPRASVAADESERPYFDVVATAEGVSIPKLKWRELLFVGAVRPDEGAFVRNPAHPLPAFARADFLVLGVRYLAEEREGRIELRPVRS